MKKQKGIHEKIFISWGGKQLIDSYTELSKIVRENKFDLVLQIENDKIKAFGNDEHVEQFKKILDKREITYEG